MNLPDIRVPEFSEDDIVRCLPDIWRNACALRLMLQNGCFYDSRSDTEVLEGVSISYNNCPETAAMLCLVLNEEPPEFIWTVRHGYMDYESHFLCMAVHKGEQIIADISGDQFGGVSPVTVRILPVTPEDRRKYSEENFRLTDYINPRPQTNIMKQWTERWGTERENRLTEADNIMNACVARHGI